MLKVEVDKSKNLLHTVLSQRITAEESARWREQLGQSVASLQPGFKVLGDLSGLDSIDIDCVPDIAWWMERLDEAGVSKIVRILPDPRKDIGLNIISVFHIRRKVPIVTCDTMEEALKALAD